MRALGSVTDRLVLPRIARVLDIHVSDEDTARLRAARHIVGRSGGRQRDGSG